MSTLKGSRSKLKNAKKKHRKSLRPLSGKKVRDVEAFSVADVEAKNWIKFLLIGHYDGKTYHSFTRLSDFISYVARHPHNLIFCHFGGVYDFQFIMQEILEQEIEKNFDTEYIPKLENLIPRGSGILCFDLVLYFEGQECRRIKFSDSGALLPNKLAHLADAFKVEHRKLTGSINFKKLKRVTQKLITYNKNDCMGLWEVIATFYGWELVKKSGMALTTASQSMLILRTYLKESIFSLSDEVDKFVRSGYLGGRVEIIRPYYESKTTPLNLYDVTSIYPHVMRNNKMPGECLYSTDHYSPKEMQMLSAKVFVPKDTFIPFLGTRYKGKLIFPVGTFRGVWTSLELEYAKKLGVKILEVYEGYSFANKGYLFKDFIDDMWDIRKKSEPGSVENILSKLIMNANYGRHGLKAIRENLVFDEFNDKEKGITEFLEIKAGKNTVQVSKKKVELTSYSNVMISAWITAGARIHMHKLFTALKGNVYYTDTDSLFTPEILPTSKELGALKLEERIKRACFLLPKTYCYELWEPKKGKRGGLKYKKVVMKGFDRKRIQRFTFEDFRMGLAADNSQLKKGILRTGMPRKFARIKTAMKKGGLLYLTERSTRAVKSKYDKRRIVKVGNTWTTKPLVLRVTKRIKNNGNKTKR